MAGVFKRPTGDSGIESGTYTGDGSTTGRAFSLGFKPAFVELLRLDTSSAEQCAMMPGVQGSHRVAGGTLSTTVEMTTQVYISSDGFVVGDGGADGNASGAEYQYVAWQG